MKKGIDCVGIFVTGICHDGAGNVLFRRRGPGARDEIGNWDPGVGGGLDFDETIEDCLVREMKEEAGVEPIEFEFLGPMDKFRNLNGNDTHWLGLYYKCLIDRKKVVTEDRETNGVIWAPFDQHPEPMMTGFADTFEKFKHHFPS